MVYKKQWTSKKGTFTIQYESKDLKNVLLSSIIVNHGILALVLDFLSYPFDLSLTYSLI